MDSATQEQEDLIPVRATVNLRGLRVGETALVDPTDTDIAEQLEAEHLVPS